jgi:hypothetical protein
LAIDFVEAEDVVAAWLASPTHKENMLLDSYTETGVAVVTGEFQGGTSTIVVHMFGLPSQTLASVSPVESQEIEATTTPTPTPMPSSTPAPAASEDALPIDTTPPEPPRITAKTNDQSVTTSVALTIEAEVGATVKIMVNDRETTTVIVPDGGSVNVDVPLSKVADGSVKIESVAYDEAGNVSAVSGAIMVTKDTAGPRIDEKGLKFMITMKTDDPKWWVMLDDASDVARAVWRTSSETYEFSSNERLILPFNNEALALSLYDERGNESIIQTISLAPVYHHETNQQFVATPAKFNRAARVLMTTLFVIVLALLSLAVIVHIRVQRPALITHASLVLLLATVLLLW